MLINAVLRLLPLPFSWRHAARRSERAVVPRSASHHASKAASSAASDKASDAASDAASSAVPEAGGPRELSLAPGQWTLLKLARGTVLHVHEGEACIEDAPRLWADHCWSEPRRLRTGEVCVLPRTGWWRIDGRAAGRTGGVHGGAPSGGASGACRISARPPAAPRSRRQPPY